MNRSEPVKRKPPANLGNLPTETDSIGNVTIVWQGRSIREQFPWTRSVNEPPKADQR